MDRINNNNNNGYVNSFSGSNEGKPIMRTKEEKIKMLIPVCKQVLSDIAEREVPENGKFLKVYVDFPIPETMNEGILTIEHDEKDPKNLRRLSLGVHHQSKDRLFSNHLLTGTKKEIIDYLKDSSNQDKLIEFVSSLSDKNDEYYSSL